jgi:hypothetical protein
MRRDLQLAVPGCVSGCVSGCNGRARSSRFELVSGCRFSLVGAVACSWRCDSRWSYAMITTRFSPPPVHQGEEEGGGVGSDAGHIQQIHPRATHKVLICAYALHGGRVDVDVEW